MKYIFTFLITIISIPAFAQQISYSDWKEKAKTEVNLQPEYGGLTKDKEHIAVDNDFIKLVLKTDTTARKGSEHMVKLGFDYLYKGDLVTAMHRFNQAWLIDPKNENAYWGYAAVYFTFNDIEEALKQLNKGLVINPNSSNILTDKGTIYMNYYMRSHKPDDINNAIVLFNQSYRLDSKNQNTLFKLSAAYFYKRDCPNAWKFYNKCMELGGKPIPNGYADALKTQCKL